MPFKCSICEEESTRICVYCTKDACSNHLCEKCLQCSDCCECEVPLQEHPAERFSAALAHGSANGGPPEPDPKPEPPAPPPDPDRAEWKG